MGTLPRSPRAIVTSNRPLTCGRVSDGRSVCWPCAVVGNSVRGRSERMCGRSAARRSLPLPGGQPNVPAQAAGPYELRATSWTAPATPLARVRTPRRAGPPTALRPTTTVSAVTARERHRELPERPGRGSGAGSTRMGAANSCRSRPTRMPRGVGEPQGRDRDPGCRPACAGAACGALGGASSAGSRREPRARRRRPCR